MTIVNDSVSERSVCDAEAENLYSSSDSDSDDELFEDCLSRNTSLSKSGTSDDGYPSSDDTFYSSLDVENTAVETNLPSISGDGTLTDHTIDKKATNCANAAALSPPLSRTDKASNSEQESPLPSGTRRNIVIHNSHGDTQESVDILNVGNLSSGHFETEIPDISGYNEQLSSDSSDFGWTTVKSRARKNLQSRSKTLPVTQATTRQIETPSSCSKQKTASQARMNTTKKTSRNMKTRGKLIHPRFTMRNPNTYTPASNQLHHRIPTEPTLSSVGVRNPSVGTRCRFSYSEAAGYSVCGKRDVTTDLNRTAGSSGRLGADAFEVRNNVSTSHSSSVNEENQSGDNVQLDQGKSNLSTRTCPNGSDSEASNSCCFSPAVGTPVRIQKHYCNLKEEAQNVSLPIVEEGDSFPHPSGNDSASDSELNIPCINLSLGPVQGWMWEQPEFEFTDESSIINISSAPGRIDTSSNLQNSRDNNSDVIDSSKQSLFAETSNESTSSISEGASSAKTLSTKSSNALPTLKTEGLILQPPSEVDKFYHSSGGENEPSNFLNKNELHTPDNFSSAGKARLKKSLNVSAACESSYSDNVSPFFRQVNALEFQSITYTNTSQSNVRNENIESVLNKSRSPSSPQNKKTSMKSQVTNVSFKDSTENISPAKSISENPFQRLDNDNGNKFTATPNEGETMMASSEINAFLPCTNDKVKIVHQNRNPSSSQSFSHCLPERPVSKNDFSHKSLEGPILRSAFSHTSSVRIPSNSATSHIFVRSVLENAFPDSFPVRTVSNSGSPQISPLRPVFNRTFPPTSSAHSVSNNATFPTSTAHSSVNRRVPHVSINHPVSNMVFQTSSGFHNSADHLVSNSANPHTSANSTVSNSANPHTSANSMVSKSATPHNSIARPVSNSAVPYTVPRNPSSSNPFPQTANPNFAAYSGPFKINYTQQPPPQQPGTFQFPPPGNFHQPFAQPHNNLARATCASMRRPIPSSFEFPPRVFSYQSAYTQPGVFIPLGYSSHSFAPQTNHPPIIQQTMHIPSVPNSSTNSLDSHSADTHNLNTQRPLNPSYNPYGIIHTGPNRHTKEYFPEYLILKQKSGLLFLTLETNSGKIYYSVNDWQVTDPNSDTDDSSFAELSNSELSLLNRKDVFRYFRRLERRRIYVPSAKNTLKLSEKPHNQLSSKESKSRAVNLDAQSCKPSVIDQYPIEIKLDFPSGLGCTFLTLKTQSGQAYYSVVSLQFTDSDSDTDDSSFTELSRSEINLLNRKDCNRYFRRLRSRRNRDARCQTSKLPDEPDNPSSAEESYGVNLNEPDSRPTVKGAMNVNLPVPEERNKDVSSNEKQTRTRSKSEKTKNFMNPQSQAGRQFGFRRSTSLSRFKKL